MLNDSQSIEETVLVDNIINKINIYMQKNNQTLFNFATKLGFAYQPFYKLVNSRGLPNLSSLATLANRLGYTVDELVSDKVIVEINIYNDLKEVGKILTPERAKIYLSADKYIKVIQNELIAVKFGDDNFIGCGLYKIFSLSSIFENDGEYLVVYCDKISLMNVISTSSKFIAVEQNNNEIKIPLNEVISIGKLFDNCLMYEPDITFATGKKIINNRIN